MKRKILLFLLLSFILALFLVPDASNAAQVSLAWDENDEPDLAGYKLYVGFESRNYTTVVVLGLTTSHTRIVSDGVVTFFTVTAYNTQGYESAYSNEVLNDPFELEKTYRSRRR
jgi:hypothetical protein